jgi:hypothetical protein
MTRNFNQPYKDNEHEAWVKMQADAAGQAPEAETPRQPEMAEIIALHGLESIKRPIRHSEQELHRLEQTG